MIGKKKGQTKQTLWLVKSFPLCVFYCYATLKKGDEEN